MLGAAEAALLEEAEEWRGGGWKWGPRQDINVDGGK